MNENSGDKEDALNFLRSKKTSTELNEPQMLKEIFSPTTEINRLQLTNDFNQDSMLNQPRNRLGLLLPPSVEVPSPASDTTPTQTPQQSRSKQGSPFYAEPADALGNVIRRSQRSSLLSQTQRHSEPPKAPLRTSQFHQKILSPVESEKSHISGSLDELKKRNRTKARNRIDQWPLDSSWEFMCNDESNDYDTDANWTRSNGDSSTLTRKSVKNERQTTINQIIAKRLPELKIIELLQKTTQPANASPGTNRSSRGNRVSAYDNVERGHSGYANSAIYHDSTQSDDGTVFSEPWDSSPWDSYLPNDGNSISSDIHQLRDDH